MDETIGDIHGMEQFFTEVKTSAELRHLGKSSSSITRACQGGTLRRICHGAYIKTSTWNSWDARARCIAQHVGFLKTRSDFVLSHVSAALWWDAPLLRLPRKIWVSHPTETVRSTPKVHVSRARKTECSSAVFHQGAFVTPPLQTAVDCALTLPILDALCIVDFFLNQGLIAASDFTSSITGLRCKGVKNAREVSRLMSERSESPAETVTRYRIAMWGFTPPKEQATIWVGSSYYRPDFLWEELKLILEVDGYVKYDGTYGDPGAAIRAEKRRHRDLEKLGYRVIRVQWEDIVHHPENLRILLVNAGVR